MISRGRSTGITQDQGAVFRIPSWLMVKINVAGSGIIPSRINGLKIKAGSFLPKKNHKGALPFRENSPSWWVIIPLKLFLERMGLLPF